MSWGSAAAAAKKFSSGGRFFRLDDGDRASLLFLGEPMVRFVTWEGGKSVVHEGPGGRARPRYLSVVYNLDDGVCQQMEMSPTVFAQVSDEIASLPEPSKMVVRIKRTGTGTDTTYSVMEAGKVDDARYTEAQQADNARTWDIGDEEGAMTLDEALAAGKGGGSGLSPSPAPASGGDPDDDIPF